MTPAPPSQRCDVWLFRARFFKSRGLAAEAIESGRVRIWRNGRIDRLKRASGQVRVGDRLIFMRGEAPLQIEICGLGDRRGPAPEAQTLYMLGTSSGDAPDAPGKA